MAIKIKFVKVDKKSRLNERKSRARNNLCLPCIAVKYRRIWCEVHRTRWLGSRTARRTLFLANQRRRSNDAAVWFPRAAPIATMWYSVRVHRVRRHGRRYWRLDCRSGSSGNSINVVPKICAEYRPNSRSGIFVTLDCTHLGVTTEKNNKIYFHFMPQHAAPRM